MIADKEKSEYLLYKKSAKVRQFGCGLRLQNLADIDIWQNFDTIYVNNPLKLLIKESKFINKTKEIYQKNNRICILSIKKLIQTKGVTGLLRSFLERGFVHPCMRATCDLFQWIKPAWNPTIARGPSGNLIAWYKLCSSKDSQATKLHPSNRLTSA